MQVTRATFIPLLAPANTDRMAPDIVRDEYSGDLTVVYTFGPQFGRRVVTHADLEQLQMTPRNLRRAALDHLEVLSSRAEFHGQPPALMLSFEGLESSLLLANDFWTRLQGAVPGQLVVGVPCRDVVIVTGSMSQAGLEKARRCVERMFFAGGENLLTRSLLVRRGDTWEPFDRPARPAGRPGFGPAHQHGAGQPPRQFQEHPSWPGERVAAVRPTDHRMPPAGRPAPRPWPGGDGSAAGPRPAPTHTGCHARAADAHRLDARAAHAHRLDARRFPVGTVAPVRSPTTPASSRRAPRQRLRRRAAHADVAQYSAVPYSAMPYSASSYLGAPQSPVPHSPAQPMSPYALAYAARSTRPPRPRPSTPRCPTRPCRTPRCRTRPCRTRARPTPSRRAGRAGTTPTASRPTATT